MTQLRFIVNRHVISIERNLAIWLNTCEPFKTIVQTLKRGLSASKEEQELYEHLVGSLKCTKDLVKACRENSMIKQSVNDLLSILFTYESIVHINPSEINKVFAPILKMDNSSLNKWVFFTAEKMKKPLYIDKNLYHELEQLKGDIKPEKKPVAHYSAEEIAAKLTHCFDKFKTINMEEAKSLMVQMFGRKFYERIKNLLYSENCINTTRPEFEPALDPKIKSNDFANKLIGTRSIPKTQSNEPLSNICFTGWLPSQSWFLTEWRQEVVNVLPTEVDNVFEYKK